MNLANDPERSTLGAQDVDPQGARPPLWRDLLKPAIALGAILVLGLGWVGYEASVDHHPQVGDSDHDPSTNYSDLNDPSALAQQIKTQVNASNVNTGTPPLDLISCQRTSEHHFTCVGYRDQQEVTHGDFVVTDDGSHFTQTN